jgi:hypothetical protein
LSRSDLARGRRCAGLSLLVAALVVAGCRHEERLTKDAYEQKVRAEYGNVQQAFQATRGVSAEQLPARVEAAQRALRRAAGELDDIEPPENVEEENDELVEGMRGYADDLDALREAATARDAAAIEEFNREVSDNESVEQMAEAAEEMKHKGYDLGAIAEE